MIESLEGVSAVREICGISGVDGIWLGFADLSQSAGKLGDYEQDTFIEGERRVLQACKEFDVPLGVVATSVNEATRQIERGYRMIALGTETSILQQVVANRVAHITAELTDT